jgi:hypothetical protein
MPSGVSKQSFYNRKAVSDDEESLGQKEKLKPEFLDF